MAWECSDYIFVTSEKGESREQFCAKCVDEDQKVKMLGGQEDMPVSMLAT